MKTHTCETQRFITIEEFERNQQQRALLRAARPSLEERLFNGICWIIVGAGMVSLLWVLLIALPQFIDLFIRQELLGR